MHQRVVGSRWGLKKNLKVLLFEKKNWQCIFAENNLKVHHGGKSPDGSSSLSKKPDASILMHRHLLLENNVLTVHPSLLWKKNWWCINMAVELTISMFINYLEFPHFFWVDEYSCYKWLKYWWYKRSKNTCLWWPPSCQWGNENANIATCQMFCDFPFPRYQRTSVLRRLINTTRRSK